MVGVDDIPESSHFWPSLTTVHQPLRDAGALAVKEIDRSIRNDGQRPTPDIPGPQITLLQPRLVIRNSSRPAIEGADFA